ncbi:MAG: FIST C-terminal domain-containing protein [Candidatus Eisenbacteria bacterium]|nr:FIST C-terminal domain-containing protein [Candidatus Eisenbacteria bacterium]
MPQGNRTARRAALHGDDPAALARELAVRLDAANSAAVVFFISPLIDRDAFAAAAREAFAGTIALGCTTAGELGPNGMDQDSVVGFSLPRGAFHAAGSRIEDIAGFTVAAGGEMVSALKADLAAQGVQPAAERTFAMLLVDGLSVREELVASSLSAALGDIALFGGSAGDGLRFEGTHVYADGGFRTGAAALLLVHTELPFRVFKTQHLTGTDTKLVVTEADAPSRVVREIDGEPADQAYARLVGVDVSALTPEVFAAHPVVVRLGGQQFVRSIQKRNGDGSLTFYCAIEEGLVLSLAQAGDLHGMLGEAFRQIALEIGPPQLIIGCDCILRRLEVDRTGARERVSRLLEEHHVVGFSTYGEQINGMHVNQTFTGVAIGSLPKAA